MKNLIKIMLLPISLWSACTNSSQRVANFIPGTYVNHAQSAYSVADDTLLITQGQQNPNSYHITRKTGFQRIKDGKPGPAEHKTKTFTALWDEGKQTLQITQNGIILLFQPDQSKLLIENSTYIKLKD